MGRVGGEFYSLMLLKGVGKGCGHKAGHAVRCGPLDFSGWWGLSEEWPRDKSWAACFLQAKVLPARTLLSCTYPGSALALLIKNEVLPALASVTALMLTGRCLNLNYSSMNAPFMPCAGLGDSAPSPESPFSKISRESGQGAL